MSQIFVAAENIRYALTPRESKFRQLMTDAFSELGKTKQSIMLSKLGICYSRTTRDKYWKSRCNDILVNNREWRMQMSKYSYSILLFDNIGFKN